MKQLLAIDCGNTRLKWGVHDGSGWASTGALPLEDALDSNRLSAQWTQHRVQQVIVSNVAGKSVATAISSALDPLLPRFIAARPVQCGVSNRYLVPEQLGSDRWAALIAAHKTILAETEAPRLVIMAGTALTVDALTREGDFIGGLILPGPALMRAALNKATAGLPGESGNYETFPTSTLNAISTGVVEACVGAIMRMHSHLLLRSGIAPFCILSGGAAGSLIPHLERLSFLPVFNENLVLDGLHAIATDMNPSKAG